MSLAETKTTLRGAKPRLVFKVRASPILVSWEIIGHNLLTPLSQTIGDPNRHPVVLSLKQLPRPDPNERLKLHGTQAQKFR